MLSILISRRYIDDIFMTTNRSIEEITVEVEKASCKDENIKIQTTISTSVHFLDVTVTNEDGFLRTSLFHKPTAEPYILPYTSDHTHHVRRNIPYAALLRAARICSDVNDFSSECIRIDMSLLLNGYPPNFLSQQVIRFFQLNTATSVMNQLDEEAYHRLHRTLLHQPTRREKQLTVMMKDPVVTPVVLQQKIWNMQMLYPHYIFDTGLSVHFPNDFYRWWKMYYAFPGSFVERVEVRLVANTNRTLERFIIRKKPPTEVLTRKE